MEMTVTYTVDQDLYHKSETKHDISLVTTEYTCGNELLAHILIGKNLNIHLNNRLGDLLPAGDSFQNERFFSQKTYNIKPRAVTRGAFEAKMKRFDMSQTAIEREILEEYDYTNADGLPDHVQIVMIDDADTTTAEIEFEDAEQYDNFPCPPWLVPRPA